MELEIIINTLRNDMNVAARLIGELERKVKELELRLAVLEEGKATSN